MKIKIDFLMILITFVKIKIRILMKKFRDKSVSVFVNEYKL